MVAYWVALLALAPVFGGIVGLSLVLVPVLLSMSLSIGTLSRLAGTWSCPDCGTEVHTPEHIRHTFHARAPHIREQAW
jgi:hypothetical protein